MSQRLSSSPDKVSIKLHLVLSCRHFQSDVNDIKYMLNYSNPTKKYDKAIVKSMTLWKRPNSPTFIIISSKSSGTASSCFIVLFLDKTWVALLNKTIFNYPQVLKVSSKCNYCHQLDSMCIQWSHSYDFLIYWTC